MPCAVLVDWERCVNRRILAVMLGGLSLLGPLSIDAYLPAFADIQRDFQAGTADLQLTLSGYLLAFACMSLMHGPLSDAFGRRRVILPALLAFGLASLGCALSPSVGWLTAFRVVQPSNSIEYDAVTDPYCSRRSDHGVDPSARELAEIADLHPVVANKCPKNILSWGRPF